MKNVLNFTLTFFFGYLSLGQNTSGKITYKVIPPKIEFKDSTNVNEIKFLEKFNENLKRKKFSLFFNTDFSLFRSEENLNVENDKNSTIEKINYNLYSKYSYFFNLKSKECYKVDNSESRIIIKLNDKLNWQITTESKKIDGYLCIKATTNKSFFNNKGERVKKITAWFCSEISYPFGPLDYNGLPGLILELQDNKLIYSVDKIEFDNKYSMIEMPKGKIISEDEHLEKLKEQSNF
ncbi:MULTISPECIES: GLPGLI family protein [Flavobacterium]|uniref:GLPGLI family protein n=1 Tax=Flavobacterium jumunjinense TaxID=998845 RepID=A0ABV5GKR6_9FLAO|nr:MULTISPECIES: GLPGLI family protein [Flavobacterium]